MNALRRVRYAAWAAVAAAIVVAIAVGLYFSSGKPVISEVPIGGPFVLVDQSGNTVTEADLSGHASALFFGFTYCPDVCPTTLMEITGWLRQLGDDADRLKVYFITVDPERDTPQQLASYLTAFDPRIIGLTGDRTAVDEILGAYHVYSRKVLLDDGGYTMDHTASIYLLDDTGEFVGTISYGEDSETALGKLNRLIGNG